MGVEAGLYLKVGRTNNSLLVLIIQQSLRLKLDAYQIVPVIVTQLLHFLHGFKKTKMRKKYKIVIIR
jgi:hypothetical protein